MPSLLRPFDDCHVPRYPHRWLSLFCTGHIFPLLFVCSRVSRVQFFRFSVVAYLDLCWGWTVFLRWFRDDVAEKWWNGDENVAQSPQAETEWRNRMLERLMF